MNLSAEQSVREIVLGAIAAKQEIGMQVVAYLNGKKVIDIAEGLADPEKNTPVTAETLFNAYSVTKAVSAVCVHILVDRGLIDYEDQVAKYWPEYGVHGKEKTTVRDVLTHRTGVPQMPEGITPDMLQDWDTIVSKIAALKPIEPPGQRALYQPLTHGWLIGELVQRADPGKRSFSIFVREEICEPLQAPDLWIGLPDEQAHRVAKMTCDIPEKAERPPLAKICMPDELALAPRVFEQPQVRRAVIPAVGGIFTARSCARLWAMLAQGGILDGRRILSEALVKTFNIPRKKEPDLVMYGRVLPLSIAGFWLGMEEGSTAAARDERTICHPGAGNSIGWADPETRLAVAICHNRMYQPGSPQDDAVLTTANAIRTALMLD